MRRASLILLACLATPVLLAGHAPGGEDEPAPAVSQDAERRALDETKRFVASGGDLGATLAWKNTLLGHAAMNVTRLHDAVEKGYSSVARYLVEHGADPRASADSKSHYNQLTPLDVARETGRTELIGLLERYHVHRLWYEPGDQDAVKLSLDADRVITSWDDPPRPEPDLLVRPNVPEVRAAPGASVAPAPGAVYAKLSALPAGASWGSQLSPEETRQGRVFLAKSRSGTLFKVLLARISSSGPQLTLSFCRLGSGTDESRIVRDVVAEFRSALQDGRTAAAANLCTTELARAVRNGSSGAVAARPEVRRVRAATVEGDAATVVLFERHRAAAGSTARLVTFELVRIGPSWRIRNLRSEPTRDDPGDPPGGGEPEDDEI